MNQLFKILVKEEGKELELKAFDTEAEDEIDLAYKHYYIVSDIIKDRDGIDKAILTDSVIMLCGGSSRFNHPELNFVLNIQHPIPQIATQMVHGPVVFCRRIFVEDYGLAYSSLIDDDIKDITRGFNVAVATNDVGEEFPTFINREAFRSK
ncbi:hypothetical protein DJ87_3406 [Bacillus cereus]|uniref:hypothetical protein n=1 Tax=Bacillus TaxID=1386 RepID=UPI00050297A2|nr:MULTISPECIES: hypothetical protein [Bacillus]HDR7923532.1 hypothetical protein [Bacillus paranthracis]HDX9495700.1 hypothetical protein [Bacillus thuringiensis]KFK71706.1 hypothetical protein DJ87_3406 [Bacillus cereus]MDA1516045.1 hypothetical protein [Bacillus cereus group sp. TH40LC]MDX5832055.1 hypothetical protein [Bacillus cereus group sp. BfR-BA-01748]